MKKIVFLFALISTSVVAQEEAYQLSGISATLNDNYLPRPNGIFYTNVDYSASDYFSVNYLPKNGQAGWKHVVPLSVNYAVFSSSVQPSQLTTDIFVYLDLLEDNLTNHCLVMRMTETGEIIWSKLIHYAISDNKYGSNATPLTVNNQDEVTVTSTLYSTLLMTKLDSEGNMIFSKMMNSLENPDGKNPGFSVIATTDGGYIATMKEGNNPTITKLNANLQVEWAKEWGIDGYSHPKLIAPFPNGNYCIVGEGDFGTYIVAMDPAGNILSYKYGLNLYYPYVLTVIDDNHISLFDFINRGVEVNLMTNQTTSKYYTYDLSGIPNGSNGEANLLDPSHNMLYLNMDGNDMGCFTETVIQSSIDNLSFSPDIVTNTDIVLQDLGTVNNYTPTTTLTTGTVSLIPGCSQLGTEETVQETFRLYPNPSQTGQIVTIQLNTTDATKLQLISLSGNVVEAEQVSNITTEIQFTTLQQAGMYFVQLLDVDGNIIAVEKLVIE